MPSARSLFLFDMDGVLIDSFEVWFQVMNETARELGHAEITREQIVATWGQGIRDDVDIYYQGSTIGQVEAAFLRHFGPCQRFVERMAGSDRVVRRLRAQGHQVAVVTNTPRELAHGMLAAAEIEADFVVGGTDVPRAKPAPDMVVRVLEHFGSEPEGALLIGDSRYDQQAAESAGVPFIAFGDELKVEPRVTNHRELEHWLTDAGDLEG